MLLVNSTMYRSFLLAFVMLSVASAKAQENSPFSRYGVGDLYPQQTIASRAMGGVTAAFTSPQAINTVNPASYGFIPQVTFDVGISIDQRTLKSKSPLLNYSSANFLPSYVMIGVPLNRLKGWGAAFGIKPVARINYSVEELVQNGNADTLQKLHQGNGGLTQAFIGIGKRWGKHITGTNFSIGLNAGYEFGRRQTDNIINYIDSTPFTKSNYSATTTYSGVFINPGAMLSIGFGKKQDKITKVYESYQLRIGASANIQHNLNASQNSIVESFDYDANGAIVPLDTIKIQNGITGKLVIPLNYTVGFMLSNLLTDYGVSKWSIGADYTGGKWSDYRFYGQPDQVVNNWMLHAGGEFTPNLTSANGFSRAIYRLGFYTGKNYINADGNGYDEKAVTFGVGFNLRKYRGQYDNQQTLINTAIEIGKRGSTVNNVTENYFKLSVGFSLSDLWFVKRKYD